LESFAEGKTKTISCINYGRSDGLPSSECTGGFQPAGWRTSDGRLLFPTLKGVAVVRPEVLTFNFQPPPVEIEEVILQPTGRRIGLTTDANGEAQPMENFPTNRPNATDELIIAPGESRVEIRYTALSFPAPDKVQFRYRLEGLDADWVQAGTRRSVEYSHLRPGHYRFHVSACNNDGVWNPSGAGLAMIVEPYFWQTRTFLIAIILMAATGLSLVASRYERNKARRKLERLEQLSAIERERTRIANDIHDELGANLTRMTLLSERVEADKSQPGVVETHSRKIAANARETLRSLDEIVWAINPRNDTLDSFLQYVSHYADEFFDNTEMTYRLKIPTIIPVVPLRAEMRHGLFLVIKEALNNVLKHAHATQVSISVKLDEQNLEIVVEDNGRGTKTLGFAGQKKRNGLANMRQRMESLRGSFQFDSKPEHGTRIQLKVVLQHPT
jgi:signal transduction histidine kinase